MGRNLLSLLVDLRALGEDEPMGGGQKIPVTERGSMCGEQPRKLL